MKIFISWSGASSRTLAEALRNWLPDVIQALKPWISTDDIDKGTRWSAEIAKQLEDARAGIVCTTKDNLAAPWLNFEAGALSKVVEQSFVCPYLLDVSPSDVSGPLAQFQLTRATKDDTLKLVRTLNSAQGTGALPPEQVERAFERCWPELEKSLTLIRTAMAPATSPTRPEREILEEILERIRAISRAGPPIVDPAVVDLKPRDIDLQQPKTDVRGTEPPGDTKEQPK